MKDAWVSHCVGDEKEAHCEELDHDHRFVLKDRNHDFANENHEDVWWDEAHFQCNTLILCSDVKLFGKIIEESEEAY